MIASFDVSVPEWGLTISECKVFGKDGSRWIGFPSRQYEGANGEKKHHDLVRMEKEKKAKFEASCLEKLAVHLQSATMTA